MKPTIEQNIALATGLYPSAQWTGELLALWRDRLAGLHQDVVADSIRIVKSKYSASQPEIKWVLTQYNELCEQRNPMFGKDPAKTMSSWHVSWQRTSKHGVPRAWFGRRCSTREEAEETARATGGTVAAMNPLDEPYSEIDALKEVASARNILSQLPRERIEALVAALRRIGFCTGNIPGRISDWRRLTVLAVYAAYTIQYDRRDA
jgi:hypothetical protein